ncbi:MAG: hypothetical protein OXM55_05380 [Bdellovibrionales bacterium]|nr:hypothetical protein [Bdellovibrionales bacterium]
MKNLWQNKLRLGNWFRSCCICRLTAPPVYWLCSDCWKKLRSFYLSPEDIIREQDGWTHIRLFDWNRENDFFIRLFLKSLKKGGPGDVFNKIILEYVHRIVQKYPIPLEAVLVPAPTRSYKPSSDHAFSLALSFSRLMGLHLFNPLRRGDFVEKKAFQKQKNRQERKEIHFHIDLSGLEMANSEFPSFLKKSLQKPHTRGLFSSSAAGTRESTQISINKDFFQKKKIIFVDDILTTGATARAAWQALKKPRYFVIFTLAWRSDLLG